MTSVSTAEVLPNTVLEVPSGEVADLESKRQQKERENRQDDREQDKSQHGYVLAEFFQKLEDRPTIFCQNGLPDWVKRGFLIAHQANEQIGTIPHPNTGTYLQAYMDVATLCKSETGFERLNAFMDEFHKNHSNLPDTVYSLASKHVRPGQAHHTDPRPLAMFGAALYRLAWERAQDNHNKNIAVGTFVLVLNIRYDRNYTNLPVGHCEMQLYPGDS